MTEETKLKRKYNRRDDLSPGQSAERRNQRTRARQEKLIKICEELGFVSKKTGKGSPSALLTAIGKGDVLVVKADKP